MVGTVYVSVVCVWCTCAVCNGLGCMCVMDLCACVSKCLCDMCVYLYVAYLC